jgi:putative ABC transport system permease protein
MLRNYFKVAWRNLLRNKSFSVINILGLAVGMAGAILIFTWIKKQFSYDDFHANRSTLYEAWINNNVDGTTYSSYVTSGPLAAALKQEYPEVQNAARMYWPIPRLFNYADKAIKAEGRDVDKPFLTMFSFPLLEGDARHALDDVSAIVITESLAKKIFGNEGALNKVLKVNGNEMYKVTGVMKDLPDNTEFKFDYLVSLAKGESAYSSGNTWSNNTYQTFVQLKPGVSEAGFNQKIKNIAARHDPAQKNEDVFLHSISKWHLYSGFENGKSVSGKIDAVKLVSIIGALILLIACINFMNLSTARSEKRAKEVGVRKVIGAGKAVLIGQFLSESIVISMIAGVFALLIAQLCLPAFNQFTQEKLSINFLHPAFAPLVLGFVLITGLLAGSYPAFFLSAFKPVKVLKGSFVQKGSWFTPRKALVVVQFTVAIVLVVSTLIVYQQLKFAQDRNAGYDKNGLIDISLEGNLGKKFDLVKQDLINSGAATAVTKTSFSVTEKASTSDGYRWQGYNPANPHIEFTRFNATGDFISTLGMKLVEGRDIDLNTFPADTASILLNETAARSMGLKSPIGKVVHFERTRSGDFKIVGVFKDFIVSSPYSPTEPMIVHGYQNWNFNMIVRLSGRQSIAQNLEQVGKIIKKYNPDYPFEYQFVDQRYAAKFKDEAQMGKLSFVFAGLTIFISCLGLFGLAAYMAEVRAKEIGIRKVLGASVSSVVQLLTREFVMLVIIALLVATPIGWWLMHDWLQHFTYRIHLNWLTFISAGATAIFIAVLTVSMQAIKAAVAPPVKSIRTE